MRNRSLGSLMALLCEHAQPTRVCLAEAQDRHCCKETGDTLIPCMLLCLLRLCVEVLAYLKILCSCMACAYSRWHCLLHMQLCSVKLLSRKALHRDITMHMCC